ncbi:MAG: LPS-assembly protein LptD [Candidatus Omnitrophica bacterium]|nr:LPS-assembly protein LptD [Candidatus Omnitrophota bacterium]
MNVKYFQNRNKTSVFSAIYVILLQFALVHLLTTSFLSPAFAQGEEQSEEQEVVEVQSADSVELTGDTIEYSVDGNKVTADGNVVVISKKMELMCDHIDFSRDTGMAYATGNIRLVSTGGEISEMTGEQLTFNFETMSGTFDGAKIFANPYYGYGEKVGKVGENHIQMENNYVTTCDLDKPHYRMTSKKMDMYPGEKLIARSVRMLIGKIPLLYLPRFTQNLSEKKPKVLFTPGYDKDWGMFVLSKWRYYFNENFKGIIRLDARERKDIAWGIDLDYKTPKTGSGRIRTYYMNERNITSDRFWEERPSPTIEKERFKVEWRHKWDIDNKTQAIAQYYKLSDSGLLKDYFEREDDEDASPNTFFLLTRNTSSGVLSFRTDARVNRFESAVERLPEVSYTLSNKSLWNTGFYLRNSTTYSNLTNKAASPSEVRQNTMRVDTNSILSYPMKIGFIELTPFVGGRNTYYSKTNDPEKYNSVRGIFETGASLSTRFYRVFNVEVDRYGLDINRLRHIILPSVSYSFMSEPTLSSAQLDSFDSIDSLDNAHSIQFSIENKLQTKRNNKTVELLRAIISTPFRLKEHPAKGGFSTISTDIDFRPVDWATFYFDSTYNTQEEYLTTANFDLYVNGGDKWSAGIGKRWSREVDDQLTTSFSYKVNPKWRIQTYNRFDLRSGILKEQEFSVTRDLHCWTMDINFNEKRNEGNEIWIVFTLKAFPDMAIDFGTSFNKRKAGSQSSGGD